MGNRDSLSSPRHPLFQPLGDRGLLITLGSAIDETGFHAVRKFQFALTHPPLRGVIETIPGYTTLLLYYDPVMIPYSHLVTAAKERLSALTSLELPLPRTITIPVAYGEDFGPDLSFVAAYNHLSPEEVIAIHTAGRYPVYMLGFTPGFSYLGGLSEKIQTPRLETPRTRVPAGAVGIANNQTGIYPVDSPGGWQIIGRTPLTLFNPARDDPFLIHPGEIVVFRAIPAGEYYRVKETQP